MVVVFKTNIDAYNEKRCFSEHMSAVPRKGDKILVLPQYESYYRNLKLPTRLEVVDISWSEREVGSASSASYSVISSASYSVEKFETIAFVELWYNQTDLEMAKMAGGKPL